MLLANWCRFYPGFHAHDGTTGTSEGYQAYRYTQLFDNLDNTLDYQFGFTQVKKNSTDQGVLSSSK